MNDPEFEDHLRAIKPSAPSLSLAGRIAAALPAAGAQRPSWPAYLAERLLWIAAGAAGAWIVASNGPWPAPSPPASRAAATAPVASGPRISEEPVAWSDDGVQFIDGRVPARLLRRLVLERHQSADGTAEVRVPREDVILLPVSLR